MCSARHHISRHRNVNEKDGTDGTSAQRGAPVYEERREFLESLVPLERMSLGEGTIPEDSVLLTPSIADTNGQALQLYRSLEAINRGVLANVFEGAVMKRAVSAYPVQLRSATEEARCLVKHRFLV